MSSCVVDRRERRVAAGIGVERPEVHVQLRGARRLVTI
jgi:hypothetical protein